MNKSITVTFKADEEDNIEEMICEVMNEIQDRNMYVTDVTIDGNKYFQFDDTTYKGGFIKE